MKSYLDIVRKVLDQGHQKHNRTGVDALTIPFVHFEHQMSEGFPLLTTKKMFTKGIFVELEGFLKGKTSKSWYQERGCKIWDEWANPKQVDVEYEKYCNHGDETKGNFSSVVTKKEYQKTVDDLGPIYGYQWRYFNHTNNDQLKTILTSLKNNPTDRRMVCSAWNPPAFPEMALPPCHILWNVVVINDTLNLGWYQRSCDLLLGVPFNIASYATLMMLLCKFSGLKPGVLSGTLADCHIYVNHIDGAKEQLAREPRKLPTCEIKGDPFNLDNAFHMKDVVDWQYTDIEILNYDPHPKISFEIAV